MSNTTRHEKEQQLKKQLILEREMHEVLDNIRDVAAAFRENPGQIGLFMDQLQSEGHLTSHGRQHLGNEFRTLMGTSWANQATGITRPGRSVQDLGAAIMGDARASLSEMRNPSPAVGAPSLGPRYAPPARQAVQRRGVADEERDVDAIHEAAEYGVEGSGSELPHFDQIQQAFGDYDISGIEAHVGGQAADASTAIGARAYARGHKIAFKDTPDLHTAAHEAAHIIQQRAGVSLEGGVGQVGDAYEQHADAVADAVVAGKPVQGLLDQMTGVQRTVVPSVQREVEEDKEDEPTASGPVDTPIVDQHQLPHSRNWAFCGIATLIGVLEANDKKPARASAADIDRLKRGIYIHDQGTSGAGMASRMRDAGMKHAEYTTDGDAQKVIKTLDAGQPVPLGVVGVYGTIIEVNAKGSARYGSKVRPGVKWNRTFGPSGHWVSVVGYEGSPEKPTAFLINDPDTGARLRMTPSELAKSAAMNSGGGGAWMVHQSGLSAEQQKEKVKEAETAETTDASSDKTPEDGDAEGGFSLPSFGDMQSAVKRMMGVQKKATGAAPTGTNVHATAAKGVSGSGSKLPYFEQIQASFGRHDISDVQSYAGSQAADATRAMGARAYATGNKVAFGQTPDLHTAAHEAAHVVQQRGGVSLKGGVGQAGDRYEQHADAVADAVVAGQDAEGLLSEMTGVSTRGSAVQQLVQRDDYDDYDQDADQDYDQDYDGEQTDSEEYETPSGYIRDDAKAMEYIGMYLGPEAYQAWDQLDTHWKEVGSNGFKIAGEILEGGKGPWTPYATELQTKAFELETVYRNGFCHTELLRIVAIAYRIDRAEQGSEEEIALLEELDLHKELYLEGVERTKEVSEYVELVTKKWEAFMSANFLLFLNLLAGIPAANVRFCIEKLKDIEREISALKAQVATASSDVKEAWAQAGINVALATITTAVSVVNPPLGFVLTIVGAGTSILLDNMLGPQTPAIRTWAGRANAVAGTAGDIAEKGSKLTTKSMAQGFGKLGAATLVIGGIFDGMEISDAYDIRDDLTTRLQKIQALYRTVSGKLELNLAICNEYEDAINRLKAAFKAKKVEYKELSLQVEQHAGATERATGDDIDERFETQDIDDEAFGVEDESGD